MKLYTIMLLVEVIALGSIIFMVVYFSDHEPRKRQTHIYKATEEMEEIGPFGVTLWRPPHGIPIGPGRDEDRVSQLTEWIEEFSYNEAYMQLLPVKKIFLADGFEWWRYTENTFGPHDLPLCKEKCEFIEDPSYIDSADAYVMYSPRRSSNRKTPPDSTMKFMMALENPYVNKFSLHGPNTYLASYYRGSDVVVPYGKWIPYEPVTGSEEEGEASNETFPTRNYKRERNYALGKTELVAAFVSNCYSTYNKRSLYMGHLNKTIPVHIYGECGNRKCPKDSPECFDMLKQKYKFFLAFENANCRDYITEKLFDVALKNDVVPVVLGAHPNDYKALAPPNSYILAEDFNSTRELGEYLLKLDQDDDLYNTYFDWKNTGEFYKGPNTLCRICAMTHYADYIYPPDILPWKDWTTTDRCLGYGEWYWTDKE